MRLLSVLLLGLIALALTGPLGPAPKPECGMACCLRTAAGHAPGSAKTACVSASCGGMRTVADLPSLPLSTLPVLPRLGVLLATTPFQSRPSARGRSLPRALPERPPRA